MSYLIIGILVIGWLLTYRRLFLLRRGISLLSVAVRQKRTFLDEDGRLARMIPGWAQLGRACSDLVQEAVRLDGQRSSHLHQIEATLGSLQEAVLIVDQHNYILLANRALKNIFPDARNILNERIESVLHSAVFLDFVNKVRGGKGVPQQEIEFTDGSRSTWAEVSGSVIPDMGDQAGPCALFVLHDISRQKQLEAVRKEFVANVSHELKTPLSVIKGYIETLVEDHRTLEPDDRERFLKTIQKHSDRLISILEDLLTLSRLESKNAGLQVKPVNIKNLIEDLTDEIEPRFSESDHHIRLVLPEGALVVPVDGLKLTQVLQNLLDNAHKYTPPGSTVEIGLEGKGAECLCWVRDDGPGIPEKDLPHIFERFYRVDKGRSRETGGTGLGLSIVKHIVLLHGGQIWAESDLGRGTKIAFTLKC